MKEVKFIRIGASVLILLALLFWGLWMFQLLSFAIPVFTKEGYWQGLGMVEDHIEIGWFAWSAYLGLWVGVMVIGSAAFASGIRLLDLFRRDEYFTPKTVRMIQWVGLILSASMIWDTIIDFVDQSLLTWYNTGQGGVTAEGAWAEAKMYLPPAYHYDSGDIALLLCGLGFFLIGYVLQVAQKLEAENKAFV